MLLKLKEPTPIEDLGYHTSEQMETLRGLLAAGAPAQADTRRKGFYEVENCTRVFYIHLSPNGKVLLLAVWSKVGVEAAVALGFQPSTAQSA